MQDLSASCLFGRRSKVALWGNGEARQEGRKSGKGASENESLLSDLGSVLCKTQLRIVLQWGSQRLSITGLSLLLGSLTPLFAMWMGWWPCSHGQRKNSGRNMDSWKRKPSACVITSTEGTGFTSAWLNRGIGGRYPLCLLEPFFV